MVRVSKTITLTEEQAELVILWLGRDVPDLFGEAYFRLNDVVRAISHQLDGIPTDSPSPATVVS